LYFTVNKITMKIQNNPFTKFLYKHFSTNSDCFNSSPLILPSFSIYAKKTYLNPTLQQNDIIKDTKGKSVFIFGLTFLMVNIILVVVLN